MAELATLGAPDPPSPEGSPLAGALVAIAGQLQRLGRSGRNPHFNYDFLTFDDLLDALRPTLAEHGVSIRQAVEPTADPIVELEGKQERWRVLYRFTLTHAASGEVAVDHWWGQAFDNSDKAATKAATSAHKHYLRHLFHVSTGEADDPDGLSPERERAAIAAAQDADAEAPQARPSTKAPEWMTPAQAKVLLAEGWGSQSVPHGALTKAQHGAIARAGDDPGRAATWGQAQAMLRRARS